MILKIVFNILIMPLSRLPLGILYLVSDFFYLLLISVFPYRRKVIESNITRSFPTLNEKEIKKIRNNFYRHFADLFIESIKNLSISKEELLKRVTVHNLEILEDLYKKNKSVLLVSGHYNNWEWMITAQNLLFSHQAVGIGAPLTNTYFDVKMTERRSRFGMEIFSAKTFKDGFEKLKNQCIATLVLSDQSPVDGNKAYWMNFLNQPTAVLFGCELMAHQYDHAVVFFEMEKIKRGYYKLHLKLITQEPKKCKWGEITEAHTKMLESVIQKNPQYWLWSHKRWKREVPANLKLLKLDQESSFNRKFGL